MRKPHHYVLFAHQIFNPTLTLADYSAGDIVEPYYTGRNLWISPDYDSPTYYHTLRLVKKK